MFCMKIFHSSIFVTILFAMSTLYLFAEHIMWFTACVINYYAEQKCKQYE